MDGFLLSTMGIGLTIAVLLALWSCKRTCLILGAKKITYLRCFTAQIVALALTSLIMFVVFSYLDSWSSIGLQLFFVIVLPAYVYAQACHLPFIKGLVLHVVTILLTLLLLLLLTVGLLFSGFFSGIGIGVKPTWSISALLDLPYTIKSYFELTEIQVVANGLCACVDDTACVMVHKENLRRLLKNVNASDTYSAAQRSQLAALQQTADDCYASYQTTEQQSAIWLNAQDEPIKQAADVAPPQKPQGPQHIPVSALPNYQGKWVQIQLKNGKVHSGEVTDVGKYSVELRESRAGGYIAAPVKIDEIEQIIVPNY